MNQKLESFYASLPGKKVFFLGAGISHKALIEKFAGKGADVTLCDRKSLDELGEFGKKCVEWGVHLILGEEYLDHLKEADLVFRTPGIDWTKPEIQDAIAHGVQITSEIESFFEYCPCRIIGITGSDGKTTSTTLTARLLEAEGYRVHLGGNIGIPLFPIIDEVKEDDIAVVELSSFQLISMRRSPQVCAVTNVTPNHLDHHKDMDEYVNAKKNIFLWQDYNGVCVLNAENEITREMAKDVKGEIRWFSKNRPVGNGAYLDEERVLWSAECGHVYPVMDLNGIRLRGEHNKDNVCMVYALVKGLVSDDTFRRVVPSFEGEEHPIEFVRNLDDVEYYNDSIASSPTRTIAGLRSFHESVVLIAGGYDKHISYAPLAPEILKNRVRVLLLCGPTADAIERELRALPDYNGQVEIIRCRDVEECVNKAREVARPGEVVFFSPASASFDAYPNFEVRGRHFKSLVSELK